MIRFLTHPPATEPLSLADVKTWCRVDHRDDDALFAALIRGARERVEARTGRPLITQGWRLVCDAWAADGLVDLPLSPVIAITAVRVFAADGSATIVPPTAYRLVPRAEPPLLDIPHGPPDVPTPGRPRRGIEIDLEAGFGPSPTDVPEPLRLAMRLIVAHAYEHRGADRPPPLPPEVASWLAPYRMLALAGRAA